MIRIVAAALAASVMTSPAMPAGMLAAADLILAHPVSRPNLPNRPAVAYLTIVNQGAAPERLLAAASPDFESAELHQAAMEDGVMKMRPVESIEIGPGETVKLEPGGYHVMLFGAKTLYQPGDRFPLVLTFETSGETTVTVTVGKIDHGGMNHGSGMNHGGSDAGKM